MNGMVGDGLSGAVSERTGFLGTKNGAEEHSSQKAHLGVLEGTLHFKRDTWT